MTPELQIELDLDRERMAFLWRLDAADFEVTDWEANFIASQIVRDTRRRENAPPVAFSPKTREKIDQLRDQYESRLPHAKGAKVATPVKRELPPTVPGKCGYFVRKDGQASQSRCGSPAVSYATFPSGEKLGLCADHAREREERKAKLQEARR